MTEQELHDLQRHSAVQDTRISSLETKFEMFMQSIDRSLAEMRELDKIRVEEMKDFKECALCGTAAVLSPVRSIDDHGTKYTFGTEVGEITKKLYDTLTGIQMGRIEAPQGWIEVIE